MALHPSGDGRVQSADISRILGEGSVLVEGERYAVAFDKVEAVV